VRGSCSRKATKTNPGFEIETPAPEKARGFCFMGLGFKGNREL